MADLDGTELSFEYPVPPQRVWDAVTTPAQLARWLPDADLSATVGQRFTLGPAGGFAEPIAGEVLAAEAPRRLVMRWWLGTVPAIVNWLIEPTPTGSRLRVIVLGAPHEAAALQPALRHRFDDQLRRHLRRRRGLTTAAVRPGRGVFPIWLVMAAIAVLGLGAFAATAAIAPGGTDGPPGSGRLGSGPGAVLGSGPGAGGGSPSLRPPGSPGDSPAGAATVPSRNDGPDSTRSATPAAPTVGPGPSATGKPAGPGIPGLRVSSTITSRGLLSYAVRVTVTNPAASDQTWHNVLVTFTGVNLTISTDDPAVSHGAGGCFAATPAIAEVASGGSVGFTFTVTALLGNLLGSVQAVALDDSGCG